jgi:hypothetical protein
VPGKVLSDSSLRRYLRAGLETLTVRIEEAGIVIRETGAFIVISRGIPL